MARKPSDGETREVARLRHELAVSHKVHALASDPMMEAVRLDRLRRNITRLLSLFLAVGLVFTTTGVQSFLAGDMTPVEPVWWGTWGVEPALAGILITLLRWEAEMLARGIAIDSNWVTTLKWVLLGSTLVMNIVPAIWPRDGEISAGMVFAHVMVPVLVFALAEVMPVVQARCVEARDQALKALAAQRPAQPPAPEPASVKPIRPVPPIVEPPSPLVPVEMPPLLEDADDSAVPPAIPEPPAPAPAPVAVVPAEAPTLNEPVVLDVPDDAAVRNLLASVGLAAIVPKVTTVLRDAANDGRPVTVEDLARSVRLPMPLAGKVHAALNGYTHAH